MMASRESISGQVLAADGAQVQYHFGFLCYRHGSKILLDNIFICAENGSPFLQTGMYTEAN